MLGSKALEFCKLNLWIVLSELRRPVEEMHTVKKGSEGFSWEQGLDQNLLEAKCFTHW